MPVSLGRAFPSEHHSKKRSLGADSHQNGTEEQPGKPKAALKRDNLILLEIYLNWEIYEAQRLQSNGATNGADKRGQRFLCFCSEWRHSDWGMKTEQHLRTHKAVHLNKQGYVLLLWAQWSPSKNMVMPHWMDARTPKLPPFHFVWKNVT